MQDKILKQLFTLFFAAALLLITEGILISRGDKNVQGQKNAQGEKQEIQQEAPKEHQKNKINKNNQKKIITERRENNVNHNIYIRNFIGFNYHRACFGFRKLQAA